MTSRSFHYTSIALRFFEKLLGTKFSVSGIENLPKQPILFVGNHFTRSETFLVPYLIHKHTKRQVRCLADSGLFGGFLGKFLNSVGAISTKHPDRDKVILKDLITGQYDWMIYPEGSMIKSKETKKSRGFINHTPSRIGKVRTGSAVLALKSELYRSNIIEYFQNGKKNNLKSFKERFDVEYEDSLQNNNTHIVPLTITYYPLRPGNNAIKKLAHSLIKKIPKRVAEELEIEGNILLGAEMNIHFGKAKNIGEYIKSTRNLVYQIPLIKNESKVNLIIKYFKHRLTSEFMEEIYSDIQINLDHVFSAALYHFPKEEISLEHLKRIVYLSSLTIIKSKKYRINKSISEKSLYKIFIDEPHKEFNGLLDLAKKQEMIFVSKDWPDKITINKSQFNKECDFHEIRRENTLRVVVNEMMLSELANNIIRRYSVSSESSLKQKVFKEIYEQDLKNYNDEYDLNFDKEFSKDRSIGSPVYSEAKREDSNNLKKVGFLLCHGYKASPREMDNLADFLNGFGATTYQVRLKGHGSSPIGLKYATWQEWYDSVQRGYAILKNSCSKIVIIGFSTGGLLSLLTCANKSQDIEAVITINAALKLLDIKTKMVPGINLWNEMLEKLKIEKGKMEYVDDVPENPKINYSRNYLKGVEELGDLMEECSKNLSKIVVPALIIQASKDPVVNPSSGEIIFKKIKSKDKYLFEPALSNHVVVNGNGRKEIFESIRNFLSKINLL